MKLLFCQDCGDLVPPSPKDFERRWCRCQRHIVWWRDGAAGILRVADTHWGQITERNRRLKAEGKLPEGALLWEARAFVIGIHNGLLTSSRSFFTADAIAEIIEGTPDSYAFKRLRSLIVRIRPGESSDTAWQHMKPEEMEA